MMKTRFCTGVSMSLGSTSGLGGRTCKNQLTSDDVTGVMISSGLIYGLLELNMLEFTFE